MSEDHSPAPVLHVHQPQGQPAPAYVPAAPVPPAAPQLPEDQHLTTDKRGRKIVFRKLTALLRLDLATIIGGEAIQNPGVAGPSALAFSVVSIDGYPEVAPIKYSEIRALVGRLDDDGLNAIGEAMGERWPEAMGLDRTDAAAVKN